ncbi:phosphatidylserine decarboxylase-domain-containing protein [Suillus subalutaceus]|uniref:phosphatidylserine decarboxylase-domain-containing protein n=1 Tax=Suillus subalutaceus TaxID=48586 RepID=UPI001B87AB7A|nr:phosphatidylserine decarboxylase-domain-containing protein [Suillus subalutaceus]KAG1854839.1 phosphatidylserine decarboxylase-domain-containing protein [Suillus subalutaceus]
MAQLNESELNKPGGVEGSGQAGMQGMEMLDGTIAEALKETVERSSPQHADNRNDVTQGIHGHLHHFASGGPAHHLWLSKFVPQLQSLAAKYHVGNYVAIRGTNERIFESMPIYARLGMHILFYGREQVKLLEGSKRIESLLMEQSKREGQIYDSPESRSHIPSFIHTYNINTSELLYPPESPAYKNFNHFFYRKLKPDARPVQNPDHEFCSAADSRLVVYPAVHDAQTFWIKGNEFTVPALLGLDKSDPLCRALEGGSLASFRLAPSDYHRFHSLADATVVGEPRDIPGQYFTVNPQAVNEKGLDVLSANKRSVLLLNHDATNKKIAFVAVGALLVGSIQWTVSAGSKVRRGDELGFFAYGGSTIVAILEPGMVEWDSDLVANSSPPKRGQLGIETMMKVGWSIGKMPKDKK